MNLESQVGTGLTRSANDNREQLSKAGVSTDDGAVYLAHFAGPGAAIRILKAREIAPIKMLMGAKAVKANPFLKGKTAGWVRDWAARKMAG